MGASDDPSVGLSVGSGTNTTTVGTGVVASATGDSLIMTSMTGASVSSRVDAAATTEGTLNCTNGKS